jgi:membrane-associated protease RseP (regulator of RpoE activity)
MSYAVGVIAFVVALLLSVVLHEAGHFATAKAFGMKASRFFVGFGPTIWSFRRGETEYGVKVLPAGGFVKIEGMTQLEEMPPGEESRAFWRQPAGQRAVVLVAGSLVHFIIAILVVFGYLAITHDDPIKAVAGTTVGGVSKCLDVNPDGTCPAGAAAAPALGKFQAGDRIVAVDGQPITSGQQLISRIQASPGQALTVTVLRRGRPVVLTVTPQTETAGGRTIGKIGIEQDIVPAHVSVGGSFARTFTALGEYTKLSAQAIGDLPHELAQIFEGQPRSPDGAASIVDIARVSGQVAESHTSIGERIGAILLIVAELNFFVGIFNLLPLLPLDGGHLAILAFEEARTRVYRLVGRPDPGRVDIMKVLPVTYAVVAVFVGLSLILIYAGITNPITIQ